MTTLKKLALSFTLMSVLAAGAFAGEMPCPPSVPGEVDSPPSSSAQASNNDSVAPGEMNSPPSLDSVDLIGIAGTLRSLLFF